MGKHNIDKLSLIWDKRQKDFVFKYPRRCDGSLIVNHICSNVLKHVMPSVKKPPFNFETISYPKAKKDHVCEWCAEKIPKRSEYVYEVGSVSGDFYYNKYHHECHSQITYVYYNVEHPEDIESISHAHDIFMDRFKDEYKIIAFYFRNIALYA